MLLWTHCGHRNDGRSATIAMIGNEDRHHMIDHIPVLRMLPAPTEVSPSLALVRREQRVLVEGVVDRAKPGFHELGPDWTLAKDDPRSTPTLH